MKIFRTKNNILNHWLDVLFMAGFLAVILYAVFWPAVIRGSSMSPALNYGDVVFISRVCARISNFSHGDLVMSRIPVYGHNENIIKRIVAVPGDVVMLTASGIYINGARLDKPGLNSNHHTEFTLKYNEYFILGDNPQISIDSRHFGPVERGQIFARVLFH